MKPIIRPSELPDRIDRFVAADTETSGLYPDDGAGVAVVSLAWYNPDDEIISPAFPFNQDPDGRGQEFFPDEPADFNLPRDEWDYLLEWLEAQPGLVFHGSLFDLLMLDAGTSHADRWPGRDLTHRCVWDTLLGQSLLDPEHLAGLEETGQRLWGEESEKGKYLKAVKHYLQYKVKRPVSRIDQAAWPLVRPYASEDTRLTIRLARQQWYRMMDGEASFKEMHRDLDVMRTLFRMERRGLPYDAPQSLRIAAELNELAHGLLPELPFDPKPESAKAYFFGELGVKPLKFSKKTGKPSLDAETVDHLVVKGVKHAELYQDYVRATNAVSKWYQAYGSGVGADGRVRARFSQATVRSGRLSAQRINLQAIPQNYQLAKSRVLSKVVSPRALIYSPPGWDLWEMDESQAELRVGAWMAESALMMDIILDERDPHGETAAQLFSVKPGDPDWFRFRQVGKRGNFSLIFGIGPDKLQADIRLQTGVDLSLKETKRIIREWKELYPEFPEAIDHWQHYAERKGRVPLVNGRYSAFTDQELQYHQTHKAFNRRVQGSIAEFTKDWMVAVDQFLMEQLGSHGDEHKAGLVLQIHDSLVVLTPKSHEGQELAQECAAMGVRQWDQWFTRPDPISGKPYAVPGKIELSLWNAK